ncbi:MAG: hypothetical protein IMY72_12180 [Bacteroidetes bacterium]|nr:hypothetical protein [Bacteroidota bacterium]
MKKLELNQMENVEGGVAASNTSVSKINACDISLGIVVGIWGAALSAATFGVAAFGVALGGGLLVGYVCH